MSQQPRFRISAATSGPAKKDPWFQIKAVAGGAELRLRGYIGEASKYTNYYGEEVETGGMGTLQEFEAALQALGDVPLITVYLTSQGGDFPTAIAISSILARQKARIVCVIDGYAYSAAPVIACAADEVRAPANAILMIHDAEFWCAGADIATLQQHIATLQACNDSMAAAFVNKAGGTVEEWQARMVETTWMTGSRAHELKLVDTLLDDVALSAYQPLKRVTAAYQPPAEITALIDTPPVSSPKPSPMKPTPELITAAAAFGITLTAESTEADVASALTKITAAAKPAPEPADIDGKITAAVKPLTEKITAQETEIKRLSDLAAHGLGSATAAAAAPVTAATKMGEGAQTMTRAEFAQITASARSKFFKAGGKLID